MTFSEQIAFMQGHRYEQATKGWIVSAGEWREVAIPLDKPRIAEGPYQSITFGGHIWTLNAP